MSEIPFGFRPGDEDDESKRPGEDEHRSQAEDPFGTGGGNPFGWLLGAGAGAGGGPGQADLGAMLQQIGRLLQWQGGPVNWDLARDAARQIVSAKGGDRSVSAADRRDVDEAVRLAELWLDTSTTFATTGAHPRTWSRAEWIEGTLPAWKGIVEPVAARVAEGMGKAVPEEMQAAAGPFVGMMRQLGVSLWGGQVGQALGTLAMEVHGSTDVGLPLGPAGSPVLVPVNVAAFGDGLGIDPREVRLYLALREVAAVRLFAVAPWLTAALTARIDEFGRGIEVDTSRIEAAMRDLDPSRPEAIEEALGSGLFEPEQTPAQQAALERLERLLALIEGWIDDVVTAAARDRLPSADALRETMRRRRATGGPAEQTFATLVGLELRPRKLREASAFWAAVRERRGYEGRDALWAHSDLLPSTEDLSDPSGFLDRAEESFDLSQLDEPGAE